MRSKLVAAYRRRAGARADRRRAAAAARRAPTDAVAATGPIKIWFSNNPEEIAWGKQMVEAWNAAHPNEQVTGAGDPGRQDLRGGHRRRDHRRQRAVPDLQHLARRPCRSSRSRAAWSRSTTSPTARRLHRGAHRRRGRPVQVAGRQVLPDAVEVEPGDDLLQQGRVQEGRASTPSNPPLATYDEFLDTAEKLVESGARQGGHLAGADAASSSSPGSTSTRCTPPRPAARSWSRTARPPSTPTPARRSPTSGRRCTPRACPQGDVQRRLVRRRQGRDGDRRPVGHRGLRRQGQLGRGAGADLEPARPPTRSTRSATRRTSACTPPARTRAPPGTSLKFATSKDQDGKLLEMTGQMPLRANLEASLPGLLQGAPGVRAVRRPGRPHRRGAERAELDRDLADVPRRVLDLGDLRQEPRRRRVVARPPTRSTSWSVSPDRRCLMTS